MPTYVYRCGKCSEQIEAFQSFSDAPLTRHKGCGGKLTKVLSAAGIVLKGSGFYKTDSRSGASKRDKAKEPAASGASGSSDGAGSSSGSDSSGSSSSSTAACSGSSGSSESSGSSGGSEAKSA